MKPINGLRQSRSHETMNGSKRYGPSGQERRSGCLQAQCVRPILPYHDEETGKILWQSKLPAGGYATPATYMAGGRQFLVIACGGGKMGTRSGDAYVAFALPKRGGSK